MPGFSSHSGRTAVLAVALATGTWAGGASAQSPAAAPGAAASAPDGAASAPSTPRKAARPPVNNSSLDASLFYQLLIGEMELRQGEAGTAYQVLLDAARRTKDEQLFRRATDIALQARAGDQALASVTAWRQTLPDSLEAIRYQIQLLVALNRSAETLDPMRALLKLTPAGDRPALINALPRFYARATDREAAAGVLEQALQPYVDAPDTRTIARVTVGRGWLNALDGNKALELARRAGAEDPASEAPAALALELMPASLAAEEVVKAHLQAKPDSHAVRLLYVQALTGSQRYAEAVSELKTLTTRAPDLAPPWLTLGALEIELRHPAEATQALQKYVALAQRTPAPAADAAAPEGAGEDEANTPDEAVSAPLQGLTQAWLLLAQAAEQQNDYPAAEAWLAKIESPQAALEVQGRRASLLARQGKLAEARELIRRVPERTPADARAKVLAEAQMLRDAKEWAEANSVLAAANEKFPDDVDLLYEQSMMAEKLDRLDDMERLLRRVIELKPDHQHAYNALGYSLAERNLRLPEARDLIRKALALSPGEPFITDSLGWVEYRLGNKDEALRLLRSAYQSRPDPEIAAHLGELLWVSGQTDEAKRVWREARSRDSANDVLRETLARLRVDL